MSDWIASWQQLATAGRSPAGSQGPTTWRISPLLKASSHGCPKVRRGASEEEAERHPAVPAACPLLGTSSVERHPPRLAPLAPRQGPPAWLQGQAGLCYLPRARPPWWSQEAGPQGCHLRQAHQPGHQPAQVPALAQVHRRGACRAPLRQPARPELVLDQPGLDLQVLRGHPRRPAAQGHPHRSTHQLDRQARPQAPRVPRPHRHRQEVPRSQQGPPLHQDPGRPQEDLEEAQHPVSVALPLTSSSPRAVLLLGPALVGNWCCLEWMLWLSCFTQSSSGFYG